MSNSKNIILFVIIFLLPFSLFSWTEAGLISNNEQPVQAGYNDTFASAGDIGIYIPPDSSGTGFISSNIDVDNFKIIIPSSYNYSSHDFLKVSLLAPENNSYKLVVYESDGSAGWNYRREEWAYNGNTAVAYVDISNKNDTDWTYVIQVASARGYSQIKPYYLRIEVVDSGTIIGKLSVVGSGLSGTNSINVIARSRDKIINEINIIDINGYYYLNIPANVDIDNLQAVRYWYSGCPVDWALGRTTKKFEPALKIVSSGQTISNIDFEVYKEGVIKGTISSPNNIDIEIKDPYANDWIGSAYNVNGNYEIHNIEAGNYWLWAKQTGTNNCNEAVQPIFYTKNINVKDGFETTVNISIGSGIDVSGSFSPVFAGEKKVYIKPAGLPKSDITRYFEPFSQYYKVETNSNTYTLKNVPSNIKFDFRVEISGPSYWYPILDTYASTPIDFSGPTINSVISGSVIDNTNEYPDKSIIAIYAIISGTVDVQNDIIAYVGMCNSDGTFSVFVPSGYSYDLAAVDITKSQDGPPYFLGRVYDIADGSTDVNITIDNGYFISGTFNFSGKSLYYYNLWAYCYILKEIATNVFRFYDMGSGSDNYITGNKIQNGSYKIIAKDTFFNEQILNVTVSGSSLINQNFNFTIDPSSDIFKPWIGKFKPENNGNLNSLDDYLYVTIGDKTLGSGISTINILSNGEDVVNLSIDSYEDLNTKRYKFRLPVSQRTPGTSHTISIYITDNNNNFYSVDDWIVNIPSQLPTATFTPTPTFTITPTLMPNVFGTITLPASSNNKDFAVVIDTDTNGGNGWVGLFTSVTNGNDYVQYAINVPDGTYFIYSLVDENGNGIINGPNAGDYFGFYGGTLNPPSSPNANVSGPNNLFNFSLYTVPSPTPTPTMMATPVADWYEDLLLPSEQRWQTGVNDSETSAATIVNYLNTTGIGYIASSSDIDNYKFTILDAHNNENHDFLKVTINVPSGDYYYAIEVYERNTFSGWNFKGSQGADGGKNAVVYVDISSHSNEDWEYLIKVRSYNDYSQIKPYILSINVIDSGYISGFVNLVGVSTSGLSNVNIEARTTKNNLLNITSTNSMGYYLLKVPVGVAIEKLQAKRDWYSGCPADWAYGLTTNKLKPSIILNTAGQTISNNNFNVYKEGVISGTISNATNNVDVVVLNPYTKEWVTNIWNVNGSYEIHNLEPGNYFVYAKQTGTNNWTEAQQAMSFKDNINVRDGFTTTLNFNIEQGWAVSGNVNPVSIFGGEVKLQLPDSIRMFEDTSPLGDYYRTNISGNNYEIRRIPTGIYDIVPGGGPSMWQTVRNVNINGNMVVNITGPNIDTNISGQVIDHTGLYPNLSQIAIAAVVSGTVNLADDNAFVYMTLCDATGNFTIGVSENFNYYDLIALDFSSSSSPIFIGRLYDIEKGASNAVININNGYSISGTQLYNAKSLEELMTRAQVWVLKDLGGGNYKFYDFASGESSYITGNFIENGNYLLKSYGYFFNIVDKFVNISNTNATNQNINLTLNPEKDKFKPYVGYMNPPHQGVVVNPNNDYLYFTVGDQEMGTGISNININLASGYVVEDLNYVNFDNNLRRYGFKLPVEERTPGNTIQININVEDNNMNSYSTDFSWYVYIATWTPTPVFSQTNTPTATPTGTSTEVVTATNTNTPTPTPTETNTEVVTATYTNTSTPTGTSTEVITATNTSTITLTATITATPIITFIPMPIDRILLNKNIINLSKNEKIIIKIPEKYLNKEATIKIYSRNGKKVKELKENLIDDIEWDGTNESGNKVGSGIYIIRISIEDDTIVLKVAIVK